MLAPAPFASVLYCRLTDLETVVAASWRGQGTAADLASLSALQARIEDLEATAGEGLAWTPLDAGWWRRGRERLPRHPR
jgi:hypothetical protein